MSRLDILNLEWPISDRDLNITTPILVYLRKKSVKIETKNIILGYYYLIKYKPKILLISNFSGSKLNYQLTKHAQQLNIRVISLISEGNPSSNNYESFLWGWNKDKILHVDKMLVWSERSRKLFLSKHPELESRIITVGATGFDRYKLLPFQSKERFLREKKIKYKKVIGIASWGFCHFFGDYFQENKKNYEQEIGEEQIKIHKDDLFKLQLIYKDLIEKNNDILFILRYHPGTIDFEKNEFHGLEKYDNVLISSKFNNDNYKISDLINISDLWMGYETTTALEAWLLGKQTFLINPTKSDFIRENIHKGSPIVKTSYEAQHLIDEYFHNGTIKQFEQLEIDRNIIIEEVIGYSDGRNHIRASEIIMQTLYEPVENIRFNIKTYTEAFKQIAKLILSKTIIKNKWRNLEYRSDFAKQYQDMYEKAIDV